MNRLAPYLVLLIVTSLDLTYGRFAWSWLAGPIAALALWSLRGVAEQPGAPSPARAAREPAMVD